MDSLKTSLQKLEIQDLHCIQDTNVFKESIVGGSWFSMVIKKALSSILSDDDMFHPVDIRANDIGVYHGSFMNPDNNEYKQFKLFMDYISYNSVE